MPGSPRSAEPRSGGRSPRVVHLVHAWNDRTLAAVAGCLADAAAQQGLESIVIAGTTRPGSPTVSPEVQVVELGGGGRRTMTVTRRLVRILRELEPDVVFAHGNAPIRTAVLATRASRTRTQVVGVEHNHYSSYAWNFRAVRDRLNAVLLPRADHVVGVSPGIVEDLGAVFPRLADRLRMVPPPLTRWHETGELAREPVDHPWFSSPGVPVVTSVGHLHPRKDQMTLVRAFAALRRRRRGRPIRLAIIGSASGEYADSVRSLVEELGLDEDVVLLGKQPNPLAYVARSSVFVLSSRNEGMPVSLLEAMACGTPAVSTDCPSGPRWLFEEERSGLLAPVGDHETLAAQIARVLDDDQLWEGLRTEGGRRALRFSPERISAELLDLVGITVAAPSGP